MSPDNRAFFRRITLTSGAEVHGESILIEHFVAAPENERNHQFSSWSLNLGYMQ